MENLLNINQVKAIILRNIFEWRRNLDRMVDSVWWAATDLIFWGLTSSYLKENNSGLPFIVSLFLGGIILWVFVQNSQRDINMPILGEAWNRNLINLFTTPIRLRELVLGTIVLGLIKLMMTITMMVILSHMLYQYNFFSFGFFLIPGIINLIFVGWWLGFFIDGLIFRFGYRIEAFAWAFVFVIYPFSAIFYPVKALPGWAQIIASILPTSYIFENMRNIVYNGTYDNNNIIIAFLLNIVYLTLTLIFMKYMFREARKNARLVKLN